MSYPIKRTNIENVITLYGDFPVPSGEITVTDGGFEYKNDILSVVSTNVEDESGVISRNDVVTNISKRDITIHRALSKFTLNGGEAQVYTQFSEWCTESQGQWQTLVTEIGARSDEIRSNSGAAPFVAIYNEQTGRGLAFHIMAKSAWSYNVRKYFLAKDGYKRNVVLEIGMNCENFAITLKPGESLNLAEILYYEFDNALDLDAFKLHRYCNKRFPAKNFPIIYNSWMSYFDDLDFDNLMAQLKVAKKLNCDYFVIDAGWFGDPRVWSSKVGDWKEIQTSGLMGRMKELSDNVRAEGLKFGLWFEPERASGNCENFKNFPQYYLFDGSNAFIDFANPEACDFIYNIVSEQIRHYDIKFVKFDFNRAFNTNNRTDAFLKYFEGYKGFIKRLGEAFPDLYLENCAGGGTRLSLSNLEGFNSFWMSDNHNMYEELDIYKNSIKRLPCRALEKWITIRSIDNFKPSVHDPNGSEKILMSKDGGWEELVTIPQDYLFNAMVGGPIGISCDITRLTDRLISEMGEFFKNYKAEAEFWKNAECHLLVDTDSMLVMQFNDIDFNELKLFVFGRHVYQTSVTVYPVVCDGTYTDGEKTYTADELDDTGIEVNVPSHYKTFSFTLKKQ